MKVFLINKGWVHYKTGCSCVGSPKYFKNTAFNGWKVILKSTGLMNAVICRNGVVKYRARTVEELRQKMAEYGLITED
ncbi:MAG: hypothetical protein LBR64_02245 [Dysgonamonadaceae bacterium]|jgi:hypothetical protein|nr:hypothetical protein [Dysgonamonadaceae bacterium]